MDPYAARVGLVAIRGTFTVASSHKLVGVIGADIKDHEVVIFDFSDATYIDDSAAMVIEQLMDTATKQQTEFIVMGLSGSVANTLYTLNVLQRVPEGSRRRNTGRGAAGCESSPQRLKPDGPIRYENETIAGLRMPHSSLAARRLGIGKTTLNQSFPHPASPRCGNRDVQKAGSRKNFHPEVQAAAIIGAWMTCALPQI